MSNIVLAKLANGRLVILHSVDFPQVPNATFISQLHAQYPNMLSLAQVLAIASLPQGSNGMTVEEILARDAINARAVAQQICEPPCTFNTAGPIPGVLHPNQRAIIDWLYGPAGPHPFP